MQGASMREERSVATPTIIDPGFQEAFAQLSPGSQAELTEYMHSDPRAEVGRVIFAQDDLDILPCSHYLYC
jgi:hypothetical protein